MSMLLCVPSYAAWYGQKAGYISAIQVTKAGNSPFRISLEGDPGPVLCSDKTWAYLDITDSNYDTYVAVALSAKMTRTKVWIYSNQGPGDTCHIEYLTIQ